MSTYLDTSTITDTVAKAFVSATDSRLTSWGGQVDDEIIALAEQNGLIDTDIETPLHPKISEYARAYFCRIVFRDNIGSNNVDTAADEKYRIKYELYVDECKELKMQISKNMFLLGDTDLAAEDRMSATSGEIWLA